MGTILIVDDVEDLRFSLAQTVKKLGYSVVTAANGSEAIEALRSRIVDLIFLDIGLPDTDGIALIPRLKEIGPDVDIVILTGNNDAKTAVQSLHEGAVDYIVKPFDLIEFKTILHRIMQSRLMSKQAMLHEHGGAESIIGNSEGMRHLKSGIEMAANVDSPVLITGETGSGKELVARAIHQCRKQKKGVFVKIDCATLSANLIESELFGHVKGAFTDAFSDKKGLVEIAAHGTLFLDEIGTLPISLQPKLLRLIEEATFRRVGGVKDIQATVRIIAATNADLKQEITTGSFREDLYYRLNVVPLDLPPLRARGEDILLLADFFLHQFCLDQKKNIKGIAPSAREAMLNYGWPGNIRELRNLIEREVIFCKSDWLTPSGIDTPDNQMNQSEDEPLVTLKQHQKKYIQKVLNLTGNNKSEAARILNISRTTLREKLAD